MLSHDEMFHFTDWICKKGKTVSSDAGLEEAKRMLAEKRKRGEIVYGLADNSLFLRFYDKTMDHWCSYNVWRESMSEWGQPLVIDLSWFDTMSYQNKKSLCLR